MHIKNRIFIWICGFTACIFFSQSIQAQLVINTPGGGDEEVAAAADYATDVLSDPWDMNDRYDLAEFIPVADYGSGLPSYLSYDFTSGIFSFNISGADGAFFHLLSPGQSSTNPLGKNGQNYPIDSTKYRYLHIRMYTDTASAMRVHWNTGTDYASKYVRTKEINTFVGWKTYTIDLADSSLIEANSNESRGWTEAASVTGLRLEPGYSGNVKIDWVRLTGTGPNAFSPSYSFTPSGTDTLHSMFLDDDLDPSNGYRLSLVSESSSAQNLSINQASLYPGSYNLIGIANDDFASLKGDPWDMDNSEDIERIGDLSNTSFSGGAFTGTVSGDTPSLNFNLFKGSIDSSKFRYLSFKLTNVSEAGAAAIYWYQGATVMGQVFEGVSPGENIIQIDLAGEGGWTGGIDTIRIDPHNQFGATFSLEFVSLSNSQMVNSLAIPTIESSPGKLVVNAPPILKVLQPDARGGEDFASAVLGNPWNMDKREDIASVAHVTSASIYPNSTKNGKNGDFFCGVSKNESDDPYQESLSTSNDSQKLDTSRYKNVTIETYVDRAQDVANGSVSRIIGWNKSRDPFPFNGDDTIIQSKNSGKEWFTLTQDMTKIKLEPLLHPDGSHADPIWAGYMEMFRIDVHEFSEPTTYCINSIEVRADDESNTQFALTHQVEDSDNTDAEVSVAFYYNTTNSTSGGTLIVDSLTSDSNTRVYLWDTTSVPSGTYYVYAVASDGLNTYKKMGHRIVIDHNRAQDSTDPIVHVDSPTEGGEFCDNLYVTGYALDNIQVATVEVLVDDQLVGSIQPSLFYKAARESYSSYADASSAGFNESFSLSAFDNDIYTAKVNVYDTAGNLVTKQFSITKKGSGCSAAPSIDNGSEESAIDIPLSGTTDMTYRVRLSLTNGTLKIRIVNADLCSQLTLIGHNNKVELEEYPTQRTILKTISSPSSSILLKARKLKPLKKSKKLGNGPLYIGLMCDATLHSIKKIKVNKINKRRKVKTWQKYLTVIAKKLK